MFYSLALVYKIENHCKKTSDNVYLISAVKANEFCQDGASQRAVHLSNRHRQLWRQIFIVFIVVVVVYVVCVVFHVVDVVIVDVRQH